MIEVEHICFCIALIIRAFVVVIMYINLKIILYLLLAYLSVCLLSEPEGIVTVTFPNTLFKYSLAIFTLSLSPCDLRIRIVKKNDAKKRC